MDYFLCSFVSLILGVGIGGFAVRVAQIKYANRFPKKSKAATLVVGKEYLLKGVVPNNAKIGRAHG